MLKLGWTYNILHQDREPSAGSTWRAKSPDRRSRPKRAKAWRNLHADLRRFRTSAWLYPIFSTRWHDLFSYAQVKTELRTSCR